ncbi:MAG: trypsin-like serine protease [Deltaproteobacteria bacterium]|nr:trypsin-like serine protease [Deltaproteobacteria bacterium]
MRFKASLFALVLASSAPAFADAPILGGTKTNVGDFPTTVALRIGQGLCTGTLITPEWVLTAAHCVTPSLVGVSSQAALTASTTVLFDTTSALSGGMSVGASDTIPNPGFDVNGLGDNDIGLIHLKTPVNRPVVHVNRVAGDAPAGVVVTMVGFGVHTAGTQNAGTEYTLKDKLTVSCANADSSLSDANLLCFSQLDGKGKCEGDSGGPSFAMIQGVQTQVGITSFGTSQDCLTYGADTRTDAEIAFIDQHIPGFRCIADGYCDAACAKGGLPADPDCPTCTADSCGADATCTNGVCVPDVNTPGGTGSTCTGPADCFTGDCVAGPDGMRCSSDCAATGNAEECPAGFDCLPTTGDTGKCWPGANGGGDTGCCSTGGGGGGAGLMLFAVVGFALRRRRR